MWVGGRWGALFWVWGGREFGSAAPLRETEDGFSTPPSRPLKGGVTGGGAAWGGGLAPPYAPEGASAAGELALELLYFGLEGVQGNVVVLYEAILLIAERAESLIVLVGEKELPGGGVEEAEAVVG